MQGMAASVGLENTSFGTNFAMMLQRTAQIDSRLGGKGKEAAEAREALAEHGIKMDFFDKNGKFAGIEHMFSELDKLKPLKDIDRMHVLNKLFGVEASIGLHHHRERRSGCFQGSHGQARGPGGHGRADRHEDQHAQIQGRALSGTVENTKASAARGSARQRNPWTSSTPSWATLSSLQSKSIPALARAL